MTGDWDGDTLVDCPHCGARIYEDSEKCPRCGEWISGAGRPPSVRELTIVKIFAVALSLWILWRVFHW